MYRKISINLVGFIVSLNIRKGMLWVAKITIDGTNVCWWYSQAVANEMSVKPLFAVIEAILDNDDEFYCVFDASIYHDLKQNSKSDDESILSDLVNDFPDDFYIVTGSSRADGVILHDAEHHETRIISNDTYKDYAYKYSWLSDRYNSRLIQGNLQRSGLITIDKLKYGQLNLDEDVKAQGERIKAKLSSKKSPEIIAIESEINPKKEILCEIEEKIRVLKYTEKNYTQTIDQLIEQQKVWQEKNHLANEQYTQIEEKLKEARILVNYDEILKEKYETIANLDKIIKERGLEKNRIDTDNDLVIEKYKKYKLEVKEIEEREREEELKLYEDKECIKKAQKAIGEFLEQYGIDNKSQSYFRKPYDGKDFIHFDGSSWEIAVKVLDLSFKKHPICEECYERNLNPYGHNSCLACRSKNITTNPRKIWDIINIFSPKR